MGEGQMKKGFTIIETMLVLSISGLLTVMLLAGWSINLNRQRYEDSVDTFKSSIQDVFNEVENPTNSNIRNTCMTHPRNSRTLISSVNSGSGRGNTNCIIMGKMIVFAALSSFRGQQQDWGNFKTYTLIGDANQDYSRFNSSIEAIRNSKLSIDFNSETNTEIEWGARSRMVTDNRDDRFRIYNNITRREENVPYSSGSPKILNAIMIVKSPVDGSIMTFGANFSTFDTYIQDYRNNGNSNHIDYINENMLLNSDNKSFNICVRNPSSDSLFGGEAVYGRNKMIRIGQSASSVEIMPLETYSCGSGSDWSSVMVNGVHL